MTLVTYGLIFGKRFSHRRERLIFRHGVQTSHGVLFFRKGTGAPLPLIKHPEHEANCGPMSVAECGKVYFHWYIFIMMDVGIRITSITGWKRLVNLIREISTRYQVQFCPSKPLVNFKDKINSVILFKESMLLSSVLHFIWPAKISIFIVIKYVSFGLKPLLQSF